MFKIQWHEKLTQSDKNFRIGASVFISACLTFLISVAITAIYGTFHGFPIFVISLFVTLFYFIFKIMVKMSPDDKQYIPQQPEQYSPSDINNPTNPYAYTTPGGIGYTPTRTGLEDIHRNSPFSDIDNFYNNR